MNKQIGLVTVTCKRDFELIVGLLETINQYIGDEFDHTLILNDSVDHMPELLAVCNQWPRQNRTIIHCDDVGDFKNHKQRFSDGTDARYGYHKGVEDMSGWMLAASLSFLFAKICKTEYYVVLASRQRIAIFWDLNKMIVNDKSPVMLEPEALLESEKLFLNFLKESYSRFGLDYTNETKLFRSNLPFVWKTSYVLDLLRYIEEQKCTILDYIDPYLILPSCIDSYLYNAWLRFNELTDTTYVTNFNNIMHEIR